MVDGGVVNGAVGEATPRRLGGIESGRKLVAVLWSFDSERPVWTVPELAAEHGLTASTAYRYVGVLREMGLLDAAGPVGSYQVTEKVSSLQGALDAGTSALRDVAMPIMLRVRDQIDETVLIARRGGEYAYCVDRVESRHPVRLQFQRGEAMALHLGSMARLLLSHMPPPERRRYLARIEPTLTPAQAAQITEEELAKVARDGFAVSSEEIDEGIWGTAAVVRAPSGAVSAVIGTAGPVHRLPPDRRAEVTRCMVEAAQEITESLRRYSR
ncbi:IclR family transcriptional regulator [Kineosporia sp. NBRC 101731]|uniref:IclR family transcriptional regulator n=1 Tax=Kineosporia sp. NBRC 101731 TaxID=3032199 RepID=UPI0024A4869B|nr:IclR family transcriptional regulator [Kineosporia sp. NBRC 101731]GLY29645.1 IclR family transcriptional regulator [Kineosporia sp. NBRC 101731]